MSHSHTIVTGYQQVTIKPASGGFGEYDVANERDGEIFDSASDLIIEEVYGGSSVVLAHIRTDDDGWEDSEDSELVEAIQEMEGRINGEPEILVAVRMSYAGDEQVSVFGINSVPCYELKNGEYVPVDTYDHDPERYELT